MVSNGNDYYLQKFGRVKAAIDRQFMLEKAHAISGPEAEKNALSRLENDFSRLSPELLSGNYVSIPKWAFLAGTLIFGGTSMSTTRYISHVSDRNFEIERREQAISRERSATVDFAIGSTAVHSGDYKRAEQALSSALQQYMSLTASCLASKPKDDCREYEVLSAATKNLLEAVQRR